MSALVSGNGASRVVTGAVLIFLAVLGFLASQMWNFAGRLSVLEARQATNIGSVDSLNERVMDWNAQLAAVRATQESLKDTDVEVRAKLSYLYQLGLSGGKLPYPVPGP